MIERADGFSLDYSLVAVAIEACLTCTYNLYVCFGLPSTFPPVLLHFVATLRFSLTQFSNSGRCKV